jgi:ABC-type multidrug transport system ATPase subunit
MTTVNRRSERFGRWLVSGPPILYLLLFFAIPALIMVLASFRTPGEFGGLAPLIVVKVAGLISEIARRGVAILLVEQKLKIALEISARVYVMGHGAIVFEGTPGKLKANHAIQRCVLNQIRRRLVQERSTHQTRKVQQSLAAAGQAIGSVVLANEFALSTKNSSLKPDKTHITSGHPTVHPARLLKA